MRIAVLISGGVDSAVVVHRLKEEGHDLHLFYIRIGLDAVAPSGILGQRDGVRPPHRKTGIDPESRHNVQQND